MIPQQLHDDIVAINYGTNYSKTQAKNLTEKALRLTTEIIWHIIHNGDILSYNEIPYMWMLNIVGKNSYHLTEILNKFEASNILTTFKDANGNKKFSSGIDFKTRKATDHKIACIKYKFNNKYFDLDLFNDWLKVFKVKYKGNQIGNQSVSILNKSTQTPGDFSTKSPKTIINKSNSSDKKNDKKMRQILTKMSEITIKTNITEFLEGVEIDTTKIYINEDALQMVIKPTVEYDDSGSGYIAIDWLYEKAKADNLDLIIYKEKAYIENSTDFIKRKNKAAKINMIYHIEKINRGDFYAHRNETNTRLDTNITGMKSELRKQLLIENEETTELDISNAQFAILAHLYPKDLDKHFIQLAQEGSLYKWVGDKMYPELTPEKRKAKAKKLMMLTAFDKSKQKYQTPLRILFPKTMQLIDKLKTDDFRNFSITLQKTESKIIIDGLLPELLKQTTCFTIHDALLIKKSEEQKIRQAVENYFKKIDFKCHIK